MNVGMKIPFWLISLLLTVNAFASDLAIGSVINAPVSGCNLTNSEIVKITIVNADITTYVGTFNASFTINGTTITESQTVVLPVSTTIIFQFNTPIDLSACGIHNIDFAISDPNDANQTNDSLSVSITNDCTPTAGSISGPPSVCQGNNSGQVELTGNTGIVSNWGISDNNGTSFTSTSNTTNIEIFSNLILDRIYRVYYDSQYGLCPSDSSDFTVLIDIPSIAGTLSSDSSHCDTILPTTLYLNGYNGLITNYQLSLNNGGIYSTFTNPFDTLQYTEFGPNFQFFAITQNGSCPPDSSNVVIISILNSPVAGNISGDDTLCTGMNIANLSLTGHDGNVIDWEISNNNGQSWTGIGSTSSNVSIPNITSSILVRAIIEKTPCGTDTAFYEVTVIQTSNAGILTGNIHFCDTTNNGFISTFGLNGTILNWIKTEDSGLNFIDISHLNDSLFYTNIKLSTSFAVIAKYLNCPADTSNFATISVSTASQAGEIIMGDSLCPSTAGVEAELSQYYGSILDWEYSIDGLNWVSSGITDSIYSKTDVYGHASYRVIVKDGLCDNDTTYKDFFVFGPFVSYEEEDTLLLGDSLQISAPTTGIDFNWTPNIYINNPAISNPKVSPPINTVYQVSITDTNGCDVNSIHNIIVIESTYQISINNFISPNGDGINDTWIIENIEFFPKNIVYVFDSYGQMVFKQSPYYNNWDLNSQNLPDGSYFYAVYTDPDNKPSKGTLTIINK